MRSAYRPLTPTIKHLISERGLEQDEVADRIGYNAQHFNRVINGRDPLTFKLGSSLAAVLNVPWDVIMEAQPPTPEREPAA